MHDYHCLVETQGKEIKRNEKRGKVNFESNFSVVVTYFLQDTKENNEILGSHVVIENGIAFLYVTLRGLVGRVHFP